MEVKIPITYWCHSNPKVLGKYITQTFTFVLQLPMVLNTWYTGLQSKSHMGNLSPQNMFLWRKDYFRVVNFIKQKKGRNLWKPSRSYLFQKIFVRAISICKGVFLVIPGRGEDLICRNSYQCQRQRLKSA